MKKKPRHSRAGGNPVGLTKMHFILLDSRLRGNDGADVMNYGNINKKMFTKDTDKAGKFVVSNLKVSMANHVNFVLLRAFALRRIACLPHFVPFVEDCRFQSKR